MWLKYYRKAKVEHSTEIAHIIPTAARFAFPEMLGLAQRRSASLLASDRGMIGVMRAILVIFVAA
jgi:hypothetical protein